MTLPYTMADVVDYEIDDVNECLVLLDDFKPHGNELDRVDIMACVDAWLENMTEAGHIKED